MVEAKELRTVEVSGVSVTIAVDVDIDQEVVDKIPWHFINQSLEEGGPGSGHHGHRGIPGYRGGSMAPGAIHFGWGEGTLGSQHMMAYADKKSGEWVEELNTLERMGVRDYAGTSHGINSCARFENCDPLSAPQVDRITSALDKTSLDEDTIVYRGMRAKDLPIKEGEVMRDMGFTSTSLNPAIGDQFRRKHNEEGIICRIRAPKGTKAGYVQKVSKYDSETELVMQRGTAYRFVGTSTVKTSGPYPVEYEVYDLEIVDQMEVADLPSYVIEKMAPGRKEPFKVAQFEVVGQDYA